MPEVLLNPFFSLFILVVIAVSVYVVVKDENIPAFVFLFFSALAALVAITGLGQISMLRAILLPTLIVVLVVKNIRRRARLPVLSTTLIATYILVVYISGTINGIPFIQYRADLAVLLAAIVVSLAPNNVETIKRLTFVIALWGFINILVVFTAWLGFGWMDIYGDIHNKGDRAVGLMRHSTVMGLYFAIALLAAQVLFMQAQTQFWKLTYAVVALAIFIGLLNALSRSAFAGWLAGFLFIQYRLRGLSLQSIAGIIALGIVVIGLSSVISLDDLMVERFTSIETDSSAQSRIPLLLAGLETFSQKPLLGTGIGWSDSGYRLEAHNMFMQVLVEVGLIGFVLFLILTWRGCWRLLRTSRREANSSEDGAAFKTGITAMLGAILVGSATHSFDYIMPYWVLLGIGFMM